MNTPRDVGVGFLSICWRLGRREELGIVSARENMQSDTAYCYNGFIQFFNANIAYIVPDNEFTKDFLSRKGFKVERSKNVGVACINTRFANDVIYANLEAYYNMGYTKETTIKLLSANESVMLACALHADPCLHFSSDDPNKAEKVRLLNSCYGMGDIAKGLGSSGASPFFNQEQFAEHLKPIVEHFYKVNGDDPLTDGQKPRTL